MTTNETSVAAVAEKKVTSKKAAAKKATKKAAKKGTKKAAAKKAPRAKKEGLRKPQVRILQALNKKGELTRADIAKHAPVDVATCVEYVGSDDPSIRRANDTKHFPSLLTLGYVSAKSYPTGENDADGPTHYTITSAGKKALAAALKE